MVECLRYTGAAYTAALDFSKDATITVEKGEKNTIASNMRLRGGNSRTLTFNVAEKAGVEVSGRIHADSSTSALGRLLKDGDGLLSISSQVKLNHILPKKGEVVLTHTAAQNVVNMVDASQSKTASGTLRLGKNVDLKVTGDIWENANSSIALESGAKLTSTEDGVIISNRQENLSASLAFTGSEDTEGEYTIGNSNFELNNAHVQYDSSQDATLYNKLTNSSIENINKGGNKLTVSNSGNSITDVYATRGSIDIEQLSAAVNLNLSELTVADSKTVGLYSGSGDSRVEANVTVTSRAEFGTGAVLNANLTLASGSTLGVAEGWLAMGSTLTLQKGLTLDDTTLGRVHALSAGESTALFTGVDGLTLDKASYTSLTESDSMLANPYFTNLNSSNQYVLTYSGTDNGTLSIMAASVPEPTTTTLSLLALSALAMRRRRK
ncbi:MAG: PEP-CTERM sorting domain-containing protein [Akkermansia sp.]|nr:PEP-CTERM sorting domain-containing protein [Akkermansia sp.]